jgi:hypothetical protein
MTYFSPPKKILTAHCLRGLKLFDGISWSVGRRQQYFHTIVFFNEADTLESSSILIYSELCAGKYIQ